MVRSISPAALAWAGLVACTVAEVGEAAEVAAGAELCAHSDPHAITAAAIVLNINIRFGIMLQSIPRR